MKLSFLSGVLSAVSRAWVRVACLALAAGAIVAPIHASAACPGNLSGSYGVNVAGSNGHGVNKFLTGVLTFAADCSVSGDIAVGENNVAATFEPLYAGSVTANADGSLMLSLTLQQGGTPEIYAIGYSSAFNEAVGAEMDTVGIATIDLKPQAGPGGAAIASYTNAIVKGAFAASCTGTTGTFTDLNDFTFDGTASNGVGNIIAGVDYYNNFGNAGIEPYAGQYSVNADGTFAGYVVVAGTQYGVTGVIDNGGNEVQFLYAAGGADITACTAKRITAPPSLYFACHVAYKITAQSAGVFSGAITLYNTGSAPVAGWSLSWSFANAQTMASAKNATFSQKGAVVTMTSTGLPAAGTATPVSFTGKWNNKFNLAPTAFTVNGIACN